MQQSWRQGANLPQDAMAHAVASDLLSGKKPSDVTQGYIDMSNNLAPFVIIYDQFGKVVSGNGYLDNSVPQVPIGVLAASKGGKTNKVTWQPNSTVRIASVSVQSGNYYVLGGRSLKDVEHKIAMMGRIILAAWAASLVLMVLVYKLTHRRSIIVEE